MNLKTRAMLTNTPAIERNFRKVMLRTLLVTCVSFAMPVAVAQADTSSAAADEYARFAAPAPQTADGQTATLLSDGRWLFVGGRQNGLVSAGAFTRDFRPANQQVPIPSLNASLLVARFGHTTTVLPDGSLFIFGGRDSNGSLVATAEVLDPIAGTITTIEDSGLLGRARHTATLLTDGHVLIAGGESANGAALSDAQLWNPDTLHAEPIAGGLRDARAAHSAALLANGQGLIWGGRDNGQSSIAGAELFDPARLVFGRVDPLNPSALPPPYLNDAPPTIEETLPTANAVDVESSTRVAIRLSRPIYANEIDSRRLTVVGPSGAIGGKIVAAADGMLLFFTPDADLLPGETYTVFLRTVSTDPNRTMPWSTFSFMTAAIAAPVNFGPSAPGGITSGGETTGLRPISDAPSHPEGSKPGSKKPPKPGTKPEDKNPEVAGEEFEDWIPSARHRRGAWRVLGIENEPRAIGTIERAAALEAPAGMTAVSGRVARLNGRPLANAAVSIGGIATRTDRFGRFLISNMPAGTHELTVDGGALRSEGRRYAMHFIRVEVSDHETTTLPDTIFLARLSPANDVTFTSPADKEIVLTHAKIPGLEIHIPKGAVLRTRDGKIVTRLNIAPLPVDRVPFAVPTDFPVYFTIQPAGVFVDASATGSTEGIRVVYPNYLGLAPKEPVSFWNYDPAGLGWQVYGRGTVSADGTQVVPDAGVSQSNLMAFGYGLENVDNAPADAPAPGNCGSGEGTQGPGPSTGAGDPVDCATGLFIHRVTDLAVDDTIPIVLTRTYRQNDARSRDFGLGTSHDYGWFLSNPTGNPMVLPGDIDLVLAAGSRVRFHKIAGTTVNDIVYQHTASPTRFMNATLQISPITHAWEMTLKDKSVYVFMPHNPNMLIGFRDRYGNNLTITRSGSKITRITSPHGRYIDFGYDDLSRIITVTDNIGRRVRYDYDAAGCLWKVTDPTDKVEQYGYNAQNRMTTVKDKRGTTMVTNVYDTNGRVSKQTLADGAIWLFSYTLNGFGKVAKTTITDPRTFVSELTFNSAQYLTQAVHAVGQPEQQTYTYARETGTNLVTSITDPLGRVTRFGYDFFANVTSVTPLYGTSEAVTASATYESTFGNLTSFTDPLNHQVQLQYDSLGNLRKITDALSHSAKATYDGEGKLATVTSPMNQIMQLNYDLGDLSGVTDALGRTASVSTDNVGRVTGAVDPQGNRGRVEYDAMNRVLKSTDALGRVTQMTYDANGNLLTVKDARNLAAHTYTYEVRNRTKTYKDPLGKIETYNYDLNGNVLSRIDRKGQTTSFTYDPLNRLKTITFADASSITLTWDAGNRLRVIADSVNGTLSQDYDGLDRVVQESGPQGTVSYVYDAAGRRTDMTVSGMPTVHYDYDAADRLTQVSRGTQVIGFGYDAANRRTTTTLPNGIVTAYGYDDGDQLLSINYDKGASHIGDLTYTYDTAGRRTGMTGSLAKLLMPSPVTSATYNAANQLTQWGSTAITYDNNGNMLTSGAASYTWNARDELTATSDGSASYAYDALGRRRSRTVSGTSTNYLHDGANPVTVDGEEMLAGMGMDEIYTRIGASTTLTRLTDALGNTVALADGSGSIVANYSYGAYGQVAKTGSADTSFQYSGRENDGGSNLFYYRARYYSPQLNRFISEDPIGLNGGFNTYGYVGGDPISLVDPLGLWALGDPLPQWFVDGWTGAADSVSLGLGPLARRALDIDGGVDRCAKAYKVGEYGSLAFGAGRLLYGGGAKIVSLMARDGVQAVAGRNLLKRIFRGPFFWSNYRIYTYEQMLAEKGTDAAVQASAGRTSSFWNALGIDATLGGAKGGLECGCN